MGNRTTILRAHLRLRLAKYMMPDRVVIRPSLPHTSNMKLDRKALSALMEAPSCAEYSK